MKKKHVRFPVTLLIVESTGTKIVKLVNISTPHLGIRTNTDSIFIGLDLTPLTFKANIYKT